MAGDCQDISISMLLTQYYRFMQVPVRISPVCRITEKELEHLGFTWKAPDTECLLSAFVP